MNVFFDVQGTLISRGTLRPHVREVFREISDMGHHIYLWSSAGSGYAEAAARALGVENIVFGCYSKPEPPVNVDLAVDDNPYVAGPNGYAITPFDGNPDDAELWKVVERLRR